MFSPLITPVSSLDVYAMVLMSIFSPNLSILSTNWSTIGLSFEE